MYLILSFTQILPHFIQDTCGCTHFGIRSTEAVEPISQDSDRRLYVQLRLQWPTFKFLLDPVQRGLQPMIRVAILIGLETNLKLRLLYSPSELKETNLKEKK